MYRKAPTGWKKHLDFMILDLICLYLSYAAAYFLRHGHLFSLGNHLYRNALIIFTFAQIFVTFFFESFKNVLKRGYYAEFTATVRHVALIILLLAGYLFAAQVGESYSRITLALTGAIYLLLSYLMRCGWKMYIRSRAVQGKNGRALLIVAAERNIEAVMNSIRQYNFDLLQITGIALLDKDRVGDVIGGVPVTAHLNNVLEYACREWIDEVLVCAPQEMEVPEELLNSFLEMGITTHLQIFNAAELRGKTQTLERFGAYTVLTSSINMATLRQTICKRLLDICGGLVGCLITGVLCVIVGPVIYLKDPGPIFFGQIRIGKNGRRFKCYKFRSMYQDAEVRKQELMAQNRVKDGRMFKLDHDPRIIGGDHGIGGIIRKYSIDEFPQFWNVLKGEMSLVGTRPPTEDEWIKYELHHRARLAIKPGITGMWQISGRSEITDFEEVVKLDREYITNWSMGLDFRILLKTVLVVLKREGSM